jgi:hypothetical protein
MKTAPLICNMCWQRHGNIGKYMTGFKVIVDKSTVPVGTADRVSIAVQEGVGCARALQLFRLCPILSS